jgi:hypothetical protein
MNVVMVKQKFPMTPSGNEPATFWLLAQCLNQLRQRVYSLIKHIQIITFFFNLKNCALE